MSVEMSKQVEIDGTWIPTESGYPKLHMQGPKQIFTFRFPKFVNRAKYDPIVQGAEATPSDPTAYTLPENEDAAIVRPVMAGEEVKIVFWNGVLLNSYPTGDQAKLVPGGQPCSTSIGSLIDTDLGPGDSSDLDSVVARFHLPYSAEDKVFAACYRRHGESEFSLVGDRTFVVKARSPAAPSPSHVSHVSHASSVPHSYLSASSNTPSSASTPQTEDSQPRENSNVSPSPSTFVTPVFVHQRLRLRGITASKAEEMKNEIGISIAKAFGILPVDRVKVTKITTVASRRLTSGSIAIVYSVRSDNAAAAKEVQGKLTAVSDTDSTQSKAVTSVLVKEIAERLSLDETEIQVEEISAAVPSDDAEPGNEVFTEMDKSDSSPSPQFSISGADSHKGAESSSTGEQIPVIVYIAAGAGFLLAVVVVVVVLVKRKHWRVLSETDSSNGSQDAETRHFAVAYDNPQLMSSDYRGEALRQM